LVVTATRQRTDNLVVEPEKVVDEILLPPPSLFEADGSCGPHGGINVLVDEAHRSQFPKIHKHHTTIELEWFFT
jgi:hypothetical protein